MFYLPDEADTLPGAKHLDDGVDGLRRVMDERRVDYAKGLSPRVFEFGARWRVGAEILGGVILILLGFKILLEHLGVL